MSERSGHTQQLTEVTPKLCGMAMQPIVQADTTINKEITHASATQANTQFDNLSAFQGTGKANKEKFWEITHASATQANTQFGNLIAFQGTGKANKEKFWETICPSMAYLQ